jgi:hypothetical protein
MSNPMDDIEAQIAAYKKSKPVLSFSVHYKGDRFDVLARDESQVHSEMATVHLNYNPQLARITANV